MKRVSISFPWPFTLRESVELLHYIFKVVLVSYLFFYLVEKLQPEFISTTFSLDSLLWWVLGLGVLACIWPVSNDESGMNTFSEHPE